MYIGSFLYTINTYFCTFNFYIYILHLVIIRYPRSVKKLKTISLKREIYVSCNFTL